MLPPPTPALVLPHHKGGACRPGRGSWHPTPAPRDLEHWKSREPSQGGLSSPHPLGARDCSSLSLRFPACAVGGVPPPAADAQTWGARPPARLPHRLAPGGGRGEPRSGHGGPAAGGAPEAGNRAPGGRARSRPGEAEAPGGSTPHPGQGWEGGGWEGSWEGRVRAPGAEPLLGRSRQPPGDPGRAALEVVPALTLLTGKLGPEGGDSASKGQSRGQTPASQLCPSGAGGGRHWPGLGALQLVGVRHSDAEGAARGELW